jgi:hypothetical protein
MDIKWEIVQLSRRGFSRFISEQPLGIASGLVGRMLAGYCRLALSYARKKLLLFPGLCLGANAAFAQPAENWQAYSSLIKTTIQKEYKGMFRKGGGLLPYPFLPPGSVQYNDVLWD